MVRMSAESVLSVEAWPEQDPLLARVAWAALTLCGLVATGPLFLAGCQLLVVLISLPHGLHRKRTTWQVLLHQSVSSRQRSRSDVM